MRSLGCTFKYFVIVLLVLIIGLALFAPGKAAPASAQPAPYSFSSPAVGTLFFVEFNCQWGGDSPNSLQRSGKCGLPKQANHWIFLTHNWQCDGAFCPTGKGAESNIPLLRPGDPVSVNVGETLSGYVFSTATNPASPQANVPCPTSVCGAIVTSVGLRPNPGYFVAYLAFTSGSPGPTTPGAKPPLQSGDPNAGGVK